MLQKLLGYGTRKAFNLAEVLIALGIIGLIAAFTIVPFLIRGYQKQECLTNLKKFDTEFNQALQRLAADNGCPGDLKCTGIFDTGPAGDYHANSVYVMQQLQPYLKIDKICDGHGIPHFETEQGCFAYNLSKRPYKLLNGTPADASTFYEAYGTDRTWATYSNGTFVGLLNNNGGSPSHCKNGYCALLYEIGRAHV